MQILISKFCQIQKVTLEELNSRRLPIPGLVVCGLPILYLSELLSAYLPAVLSVSSSLFAK